MLVLMNCLYNELQTLYQNTDGDLFSNSWYFTDENTGCVTLSLVITVKTTFSNIIRHPLLFPSVKQLLDFC